MALFRSGVSPVRCELDRPGGTALAPARAAWWARVAGKLCPAEAGPAGVTIARAVLSAAAISRLPARAMSLPLPGRCGRGDAVLFTLGTAAAAAKPDPGG